MSSRRLPLPSPRFSRDEAGRAVDALLGFLRAQEKLRKAQLFEHDDLIYLHLNVRRIPAYSRLIPHRIPLPHTLHPLDRSRTSLCLIADDSLADAARSRAASENLPFDSVISLSELRADYVPFEARRRLCDSYDIFFANRRIMHLLPRLIGNYFFRKKKMPLLVDISRSGWPEAVRHVCRCTLLYFSTGTCSVLKFGRVSMDREEIIDNLMAAIEGAVELIPKKWANVRSMYIKAVQSVALPIYQALPVMGMKIDVAPVGREDPFDGVSDQKRVKEMGEEGKNKRKGGSKKRKVRIHDVDYMGAGVDDGGEEEDVAGELVGKKTIKKDGKDKVNKSKKAKTTGDENHGGKEKGSSGEFIELGNEKKLKKAKKVLDSEEQDDDKADGSDVANDGADAMITDDAVAAADDNQDDIKLPAKKRVKKNEKRGKDKKRKKVDKGKANNKGGVGGMKKKGKSMKSEDVNLKVKKSKKAKTTDDENCGVKEKGSSGEFIELGKEEKKLKKADGSDVANEGADVMNTDDDFTAADDNQDDIKLPAMKRVKDNGKRSKAKKKKKADEERANNKRGDGRMKKGKSMKSEDMNLKKMKVKKTKST